MAQKKQLRYGTKGIRFRLLLILMLLAVVPTLSATIGAVTKISSDALDAGEQLNNKQVEAVAGDFNSLLMQNIRMLQLIAGEKDTVDLINHPTDETLLSDMATTLKTVDERLADDNSTVLTGADGQNIVRSKGDLVNIKDREYFTLAMGGKENVSDASVSKTTGKLICVIAVPVRDESDKVVGVLTRNYGIDVLHEMLAGEVTEDQDMLITDNTGTVIAHSEHEIDSDSEVEDRSNSTYFKSPDQTGTYITSASGTKQVLSWYKEDVTGWSIVVARSYSSLMSGATKTVVSFSAVGIAIVVLAVFVGLWLAGNISNPIAVINTALEEMAQGRFHKITKYADCDDEFGSMIKSTNSVTGTLKEIVDNIKNSANDVANSAGELADSTGQISRTVDDVSESVQEIAHSATQQADEVLQANNNTGQISDNIQHVTDNSVSLADTAQTMNVDSRDVASDLEKLKQSSEQVNKAVDEITECISATGIAVEDISNKVEAINSIASQTNLLALNASIEAARAGEAGKGFAVVAEEIGQLADDSDQSANEIREQMSELLSESHKAVTMAKDVREVTESQREILETTIKSISNLMAHIKITVDGVDAISDNAKACQYSKDVVVEVMSSLSAISEQNAASCEETSASMEELNATVSTLTSAADSLKRVSDSLLDAMEFFQD